MADLERALQAIAPTVREMNGYMLEHIRARRADPGDDLTSRLIAAEADGVRLRDEEMVGFVALLLVAGHITTTALLGNAVVAFDRHPGTDAALRADPARIPAAVEEMLRWLPPFPELGRRVTRPVVLAGHDLPADTLLMAHLGAANRDPARFADPDVFDVTRSPNPHLTFGHGIHFCFGAPWPGWRHGSPCVCCMNDSACWRSPPTRTSPIRTRPSSSAYDTCPSRSADPSPGACSALRPAPHRSSRAGPARPHQRPSQRSPLLMPYTIPAAPAASRAPSPLSRESRKPHRELQDRLDVLAETHRVPGAQLALDTGTELITVHTGTADVTTGSPFTADTAVPLGSLTKPFTAALVLLLADDGDLDLDEPAADQLPELAAIPEVTIRHLLTHTGGLPTGPDSDTAATTTAARYLAAVCTDSDLLFAPGTDFSYSNAGYVAAGRLVETVTGMPWPDAVRALLLEPLGIRPAFTGDASPPAPWPPGTPSTPRPGRPARPGRTWHRWRRRRRAARERPGPGRVRQRAHRPLGPAAARRRQGDALPESAARPGTLADGWGAGLALYRRDGRVWCGHDGNAQGTSCHLRADPESGVVVAFTGNSASATALWRDLAEEVSRITGIPVPRRTPRGAGRPVDLPGCAGTYRNGTTTYRVAPGPDGARPSPWTGTCPCRWSVTPTCPAICAIRPPGGSNPADDSTAIRPPAGSTGYRSPDARRVGPTTTEAGRRRYRVGAGIGAVPCRFGPAPGLMPCRFRLRLRLRFWFWFRFRCESRLGSGFGSGCGFVGAVWPVARYGRGEPVAAVGRGPVVVSAGAVWSGAGPARRVRPDGFGRRRRPAVGRPEPPRARRSRAASAPGPGGPVRTPAAPWPAGRPGCTRAHTGHRSRTPGTAAPHRRPVTHSR
ncbi:cytochrome P450 [Streptomyces nogalater]